MLASLKEPDVSTGKPMSPLKNQMELTHFTLTELYSTITPVPLKSPINIDDYRHLVMWKGVEVEQVPVKWAFSRRA